MATTLVPDTAAPTPSPSPGPEGARFVAVRANLLPDEVVAARAADATRRQVLCGLVIVVALLVAWFGLSWWQTQSSQGDLEDLQRQGQALTSQQLEFAPLNQAQSQTTSIEAQLRQLMVGDLAWKDMLATLRGKAPSGVGVTAINATMTAGAASAGAGAAGTDFGALNTSGKTQVGSIAIQGTAKDKNSVATYADRLAAVKGLTAPFISSVAVADGKLTFTVNVVVTSDALGGRYAAPATAAPGSGSSSTGTTGSTGSTGTAGTTTGSAGTGGN